MNGYLKQSTASQARLIGPFVDDTDFKTAETGLTIANTDIILRANGTTLANKNSGGGTHQANGMYSVSWDATDTANVGELFFSVKVAGALQVFGSYVVLEEAVYDALFGASAAGYQVPIWAAANSTVNLSATTIATTQKVDVETIKTQTITCAAGVTVLASVGTAATSTAQTGDAFARLGAPAGASVSADVAAIKTDTGNLVTRITSTLFSGITSLAQWLGMIAGKQTGDTTARTEIRATGAGSGTFDETTDSVQAIRDRGDAAWITATGFSTLDAAGVRTAVGLGAANLDTQLAAIKSDTAAILVDTGTDGVLLATGAVSAAAVASDGANEIADALLDRADAIETGITVRLAHRYQAAAAAGVLSGAATTTAVVKGANVATTRITATVDADGNRSAVTLS